MSFNPIVHLANFAVLGSSKNTPRLGGFTQGYIFNVL